MVPRLKPILAELRDAFHEYRFARQQVDELRAMYGEDPADVEGHPAAREAHGWHQRAEDQAARVQGQVDELTGLGIHVKDPILGLIDFYARRPSGEIVLLCYRDDEPSLDWWHPLDTGFAGRRPLEEFNRNDLA